MHGDRYCVYCVGLQLLHSYSAYKTGAGQLCAPVRLALFAIAIASYIGYLLNAASFLDHAQGYHSALTSPRQQRYNVINRCDRNA